MFARAFIAYLHYLALALGLGGLFVRGVQLRRLRATPADRDALATLFRADSAWGVAALLWIATGLTRVFAGLEKPSTFYARNGFFHVKMALFLLVFLLEIRPMVTFIKWRTAVRKGGAPTTGAHLDPLVRLNDVELALVILIPLAATLMARGAWLF